MKIKTLENETIYKNTISTIPLKDEFYIFKINQRVIKNGKEIETNIFEGISDEEDLDELLVNNDVKNNGYQRFYFLTGELKIVLHFYGFPTLIGRYQPYFTDLNADVHNPYESMEKALKNATISFDEIKDNPDRIKDIVFFDYGQYLVQSIYDNKYINVAISTDLLELNSESVENIELVGKRLLEDKRLVFSKKNIEENDTVLCGEHEYKDIQGVIQFTEEEYQEVIKESKLINPNNIGYYLSDAIKKLDTFSINEQLIKD